MRPRGKGAAALSHKVAFDAKGGPPDGVGGTVIGWTEGHVAAAEFIFQKGDEAVQAARLAGRQVFKVRIRSCEAARALTTDHRMRDVRNGLPAGEGSDSLPGTRYNVTNVDAVTDRGNVWLLVEGPVLS